MDTTENKTQQYTKKQFTAIPVTERLPELCTIHFCLIDGRLPIMAQYNPQGWCYLDEIPAKREPQVIGGKGVSHWLDPSPPMEVKDAKKQLEEIVRQELAEIPKLLDQASGYGDSEGYLRIQGQKVLLERLIKKFTQSQYTVKRPSKDTGDLTKQY